MARDALGAIALQGLTRIKPEEILYGVIHTLNYYGTSSTCYHSLLHGAYPAHNVQRMLDVRASFESPPPLPFKIYKKNGEVRGTRSSPPQTYFRALVSYNNERTVLDS